MTRLVTMLAGLFCALTVAARDQENAATPIPQRYHAIEKTKRTRLLEVYGFPEVQPALGPSAAYATNGKWAVFTSVMPADDEGTLSSHLFVWDIDRGVLHKEIAFAGKAVTALALNAAGTQALVSTSAIDAKTKTPSYAFALVDVAAGKEIRTFGGQRQPVFSIAISPDGAHALSSGLGNLKHWNLAKGTELAAIKIPEDTIVAAVQYLPDGKQALTGWNNAVQLWDLASGKPLREFKSKKSGSTIIDLAVTPDGKRFAAADYALTLRVWDTASAREIATLHKDPPPLPNTNGAPLAITADGNTVIACWSFFAPLGNARDEVFVCRLDTRTAKETWGTKLAMQGVVPIRLDGKNLLVGGGANPFCVLDAESGKELRRWGGPKGAVSALARDHAGKIMSASNDGMLYVCGDGKQREAWRAHDAAINALAVSKDRKQLLTASADNTVKLHDVVKGTPVCTLAGHNGNVTTVAFGPDDTWAASGSDDRTVILWDIKTGKKRHTLEGHAEGINAVAVSPGGDWLASASNDNTIRLWPLKEGKPDSDRDSVVLDQHTRQVTCVAFSSDGKQLLSAGQDQTLKLWDVAQARLVREMKGHTNWISAAVFHGPDLVLSASDDLTVRLWDLQTGKEVDRIDLATVSDGPRSLLSLGGGEFAVGTSGWVVLRMAVR
jgi:WD40 repeat protein